LKKPPLAVREKNARMPRKKKEANFINDCKKSEAQGGGPGVEGVGKGTKRGGGGGDVNSKKWGGGDHRASAPG